MVLLSLLAGPGPGEPAIKKLRRSTVLETTTDKTAIDLSVAEFFYATGTPPHLVRQVQHHECHSAHDSSQSTL